MDFFKKKQIQILLIIVAIFLFGTFGYYFIEDGWTLIDSLYMVAITITTVGFGEIHELSPAGRIFTIILIFLGLGAAATFATHLAKFIVGGELKAMFGRKKAQDKLKDIRGHYLVIGHGRTGGTICLKLHENGIPFVVIDSDVDALDLAEQRGYLTVSGNAASDMTLLSAGIERAAGIVTCIPDDASTLFISLAARELNSGIHIIAQGNDPTIEARMIRAGVDTVVYPLKLGGEQVARLIAQQYGTAEEPEIQVNDPGIIGYYLNVFRHFDDATITVEQAIAKANALQAVALKNEDGEIVERPSLDAEITKNDSVIMLVKKDLTIPETGTSQEVKGITWSDEFSVGVSAIDEEHRNLVLLTNEFQKALSAGRGREQIARVFDNLIHYTVKHFKNEEQYMRKYDYPGMDRQVREHRAFTRQVMELNKDKRHVFPENIADFLNSWLKNHIMGIDKELGAFLSERGIR